MPPRFRGRSTASIAAVWVSYRWASERSEWLTSCRRATRLLDHPAVSRRTASSVSATPCVRACGAVVRGAMKLVDRQAERDTLDGLVQAVRAGESQALVLSGEPGVGKSALLQYLIRQAAKCRV